MGIKRKKWLHKAYKQGPHFQHGPFGLSSFPAGVGLHVLVTLAITVITEAGSHSCLIGSHCFCFSTCKQAIASIKYAQSSRKPSLSDAAGVKRCIESADRLSY